MILNLSRPFISRYGTPALDRVDTQIFAVRYFAHCMQCTFCNDSCCSYGEDVDLENVKRLEAVAEDFSAYSGIPQTEWFTGTFVEDSEFFGGRFTRTRVKNGACVFVKPGARGCPIHSYCLERGIDYHELKPMVSCLFPLTFDWGLLHAMDEVRDRSLVCLGEGPTLYRGVRSELLYYFGEELVQELDRIEVQVAAGRGHP